MYLAIEREGPPSPMSRNCTLAGDRSCGTMRLRIGGRLHAKHATLFSDRWFFSMKLQRGRIPSREEYSSVEDFLHSMHQIARCLALDHVARCSGFLYLAYQFHWVVHRENENLRMSLHLGELSSDLESVLAWHADVEYHQVGTERCDLVDCFQTVSSLGHNLPFRMSSQNEPHAFANHIIVVYDGYAFRHSVTSY